MMKTLLGRLQHCGVFRNGFFRRLSDKKLPALALDKPSKEELLAVKINVDGSFHEARMDGAIGGVIRFYNGKFLAAFHQRLVGMFSSTITEYHAAVIGLKVALEEGEDRVHLLSDNKEVVDTIKIWMEKSAREISDQARRQYGAKNAMRRDCILEIIKLIPKFKFFKISHSDRERNELADYIASKAGKVDEGLKMFKQLDRHATALLEADQKSNYQQYTQANLKKATKDENKRRMKRTKRRMKRTKKFL